MLVPPQEESQKQHLPSFKLQTLDYIWSFPSSTSLVSMQIHPKRIKKYCAVYLLSMEYRHTFILGILIVFFFLLSPFSAPPKITPKDAEMDSQIVCACNKVKYFSLLHHDPWYIVYKMYDYTTECTFTLKITSWPIACGQYDIFPKTK